MYMTMQMGPMIRKLESLSTTENDLTTTGFNTQFDIDIADTNLMIVGFEYMNDALDVDDTKKKDSEIQYFQNTRVKQNRPVKLSSFMTSKCLATVSFSAVV